MYNIDNTGSVYCSTKRTVIHTCTAGNTFIIVDFSFSTFGHADSIKFAGSLAWTLEVRNCSIRTYFCTLTAFYTLALVNMSLAFIIKSNRIQLTYILASVSNAPTTEICNCMTCLRTFIAGDVNNLNHIRILRTAAQCHLDSLSNDCSVLVYTAAHRRLVFFYNLFCNFVKHSKRFIAMPCLICNFHQNCIF